MEKKNSPTPDPNTRHIYSEINATEVLEFEISYWSETSGIKRSSLILKKKNWENIYCSAVH